MGGILVKIIEAFGRIHVTQAGEKSPMYKPLKMGFFSVREIAFLRNMRLKTKLVVAVTKHLVIKAHGKE